MRPGDDLASGGHPGPLGTVSAVDALVTALSERVLAAEIQPGDRIRESTLAVEYQVARHTVRAALSRLTGSGLLTYQPNRGWSVVEVSAAEFADITFLRVGLEIQAMRALAVRGESVGRTAKALLEELLDPAREQTWLERVKVDMDLHRALVDQAGSRRLSEVYRGVQLSLQLYFVSRIEWFEQMSVPEFRDLHRGLCEAIDSGDPDRVEDHLRSQLDYQIPD